MKVYECGICGNTYNEGKHGAYSELSGDWCCPVCGAPRQSYQQVNDSIQPKETPQATEAENLADQVRTSRTEEILGGQEKKVYQCNVCGIIYDEGRESCGFEALEDNWKCPVCGAAKTAFVCTETKSGGLQPCPQECHCAEEKPRPIEHPMREMAATEQFAIEQTRAQLPGVSWDDIVFLGAQLSPFPLNADAAVDAQTVLGKRAAKPMVLDMPVYISGLSSPDAAQGGVLEYIPGVQGAPPENLKHADAIEIKMGWGESEGIHNRDDLKVLVGKLREQAEGRPIGIALVAGHIEQDLEAAAYAGADFVTLSGYGGVPAIFALHRARKYLDEHNIQMELVMAGGLCSAGDVMKALCLGANVVAINTATDQPTENYLQELKQEIESFCRMSGHDRPCYLSVWDICTTNSEIATHTNVPHA